jgi:hypothetical protein
MARVKWLALIFPALLAFFGTRRVIWHAKSSEARVIRCSEAETNGLPLRTFVRLEGCEADLDGALVEEWKHARRKQGNSLEMLVPTWAGDRALAVVHLRGEGELGERLRERIVQAEQAGRAPGRVRFDVQGWVESSSNFNASEIASISQVDGFAKVDELSSLEEGDRPAWEGGALMLAAAALFGLTFVQIARESARRESSSKRPQASSTDFFRFFFFGAFSWATGVSFGCAASASAGNSPDPGASATTEEAVPSATGVGPAMASASAPPARLASPQPASPQLASPASPFSPQLPSPQLSSPAPGSA